MAGGRRDRGLYEGRKVSGARMWLEAVCKEEECGWRLERQWTVCWRQCVSSQDVAGCRRDRGMYGGRNVLRARMWLEVGETEDCMVQAICKDPG